MKPISKQPDPDREAIETVPQLHQTNTTFTRRWHGTEQLGMARYGTNNEYQLHEVCGIDWSIPVTTL